MSVNVLYQTAARATGGRDGRSATLDGIFEVSLTTPKELGGSGGDGAKRRDGDRHSRHWTEGGRGLRPDHRTVDRRAGRSAG
jgi:hypothetical protein